MVTRASDKETTTWKTEISYNLGEFKCMNLNSEPKLDNLNYCLGLIANVIYALSKANKIKQ